MYQGKADDCWFRKMLESKVEESQKMLMHQEIDNALQAENQETSSPSSNQKVSFAFFSGCNLLISPISKEESQLPHHVRKFISFWKPIQEPFSENKREFIWVLVIWIFLRNWSVYDIPQTMLLRHSCMALLIHSAVIACVHTSFSCKSSMASSNSVGKEFIAFWMLSTET